MAEEQEYTGDLQETFGGLEIGAVSIKWVQRDRQGVAIVEMATA